MIGVIDYQAGNTKSVLNALRAIGTDCLLSSSPTELERCRGVILPGVGSARSAMEELKKTGLATWIHESELPILGICLGMQLFFEESEEGSAQTLGLIPGRVSALEVNARARRLRIPHMGWNIVRTQKPSRLFRGIPLEAHMYFAHSFAVTGTSPWSVAGTENFSAAVEHERLMGVQFHPEKSGSVGLQLLKNFEALCK